MLILFADKVAGMKANKKLSAIITELPLRGRKLSILLAFVSQSCIKVPRTIRLNATHYFIMEIPNTRELQKITSSHSSDVEFKDFMKLYKEYTFIFIFSERFNFTIR